MSDQYVAEIRVFPFNFAPVGWAFCNGQIMAISQNTALFSLLGTTYGGNGTSNFGLPNLQGRAPLGVGQGPGLSQRDLGEIAGETAVTLLATQMPQHNHNAQAFVGRGANANTPGSGLTLSTSQGNFVYLGGVAPSATLAPSSLSLTGGNQPHNNLQPYLTLNFCIALVGIYPQRG